MRHYDLFSIGLSSYLCPNWLCFFYTYILCLASFPFISLPSVIPLIITFSNDQFKFYLLPKVLQLCEVGFRLKQNLKYELNIWSVFGSCLGKHRWVSENRQCVKFKKDELMITFLCGQLKCNASGASERLERVCLRVAPVWNEEAKLNPLTHTCQ